MFSLIRQKYVKSIAYAIMIDALLNIRNTFDEVEENY